jgi:hypothetical protein
VLEALLLKVVRVEVVDVQHVAPPVLGAVLGRQVGEAEGVLVPVWGGVLRRFLIGKRHPASNFA